jgi:hypothetical protein
MIHFLQQIISGVGLPGDFGSGLVLIIGGARFVRTNWLRRSRRSASTSCTHASRLTPTRPRRTHRKH